MSIISPAKFLKYFIGLFVITLIWMNLYISTRHGTNGTDSTKRDGDGFNHNSWTIDGNGFLVGTPGFINVPETDPLTQEEILDISKQIQQMNEEQRIHNLDKFGPIGPGTFVILVQVHNRYEYLSLLVESLSRVPQIDNCLVIFSHDIFNAGLNEAIQAIDFTRVMQIFYPYSIQLYPYRFPGQSPDDCPRDASPTQAKAIKCRNAEHPDLHGHYREARYTQPKHHWWWKTNFIFGGIRVLQNYTGVIAFLEEDHYVTPDFLWVLNLMETAMIRNLCQGCNLIALGTYLKTWNVRTAHNKGVVTNWVSSKHNMGMAFNRTMWERLRQCSSTFCNYDDYNWDWSLLVVSDNCLKKPLEVLYAKAPRIFHIGDCGIHHKKESCDPFSAAKAIDKGIRTHLSLLFPDRFGLQVIHGKKIRLKKGNGGWGDIRDRQLCLSFSTINTNNTSPGSTTIGHLLSSSNNMS